MCISQILLGTVVYYLVSRSHEGLATYSSFVVLLPAIAIVSAIVGQIRFQKEMEKARGQDLKTQLSRYGKACAIQWASIEFPSLLSAACYFLTADIKFLAAFIGLLILFIMQFPSEGRFKEVAKD